MYHINIRHDDWYSGTWWSHHWRPPDGKIVPTYVDKFQAWRPTQQRPRDGTVVRHKTGGLKRVS